MATDKKLLWLSHVNLVIMAVLTAIVGNIALAHSKMKMPAQALKTAQVAGTVTRDGNCCDCNDYWVFVGGSNS
ncbi:hypothetical protein [Ligilactobacillus agilis]|uniref:hypothetical protein n=1 Tax=Ligilactobacillus agilis TaxID=1601 RepID=UPI0022E2BDE9|nr:hypothetical protein [Ligilactobacillus agilis]